jgi:hypothetical protein
MYSNPPPHALRRGLIELAKFVPQPIFVHKRGYTSRVWLITKISAYSWHFLLSVATIVYSYLGHQ